jgi:hypothetical protein
VAARACPAAATRPEILALEPRCEVPGVERISRGGRVRHTLRHARADGYVDTIREDDAGVGPVRHDDLARAHPAERVGDRARCDLIGQAPAVLGRSQQHVGDRRDTLRPPACLIVIGPKRRPMVRVVHHQSTSVVHRRSEPHEVPPPGIAQDGQGDTAEAQHVDVGGFGKQVRELVERTTEGTVAPFVRERTLARPIDRDAVPTQGGTGHAPEQPVVDAFIATQPQQRVAVGIIADGTREAHMQRRRGTLQVDGEVQRVATESAGGPPRPVLQDLDERLSDDQDARHGHVGVASRDAASARAPI